MFDQKWPQNQTLEFWFPFLMGRLQWTSCQNFQKKCLYSPCSHFLRRIFFVIYKLLLMLKMRLKMNFVSVQCNIFSKSDLYFWFNLFSEKWIPWWWSWLQFNYSNSTDIGWNFGNLRTASWKVSNFAIFL